MKIRIGKPEETLPSTGKNKAAEEGPERWRGARQVRVAGEEIAKMAAVKR